MPRPRTSPVQNLALAASINRSGRTYQSIAETINRVGRENGTLIQCTAASLCKWLNGAVPSPATMSAAAEAFSRLLDEAELTAADLGWQDHAGAAPASPWSGDPVTWIAQLGRDDMLNRRSALTAGLYSLAAAALPDRLLNAQARPGPDRSAGASDVERIRQMGFYFHEIDHLYGGGHARSVVAAYLTQEVSPLLRGTTGGARPELFTAAAEVTYLLGWMAADDMRAGLAQWYYTQAVRLADEAGNSLMRSTVLRSLAVQAIELGHNKAGLALAEAAAGGLGAGCPARKRAFMTGMCAEAVAASGYDRKGARELLRRAEADLERADSLPEHEWTGTYRRESFEHQVGLTLAQMGDYAGAEEHYALSVAARRPVERRNRALIGVRLAHVQLRQRHADQGAQTILGLADDLRSVSSQRIRRTLVEIRSDWRGFRSDPIVSEADHLLTGLMRASPAFPT